MVPFLHLSIRDTGHMPRTLLMTSFQEIKINKITDVDHIRISFKEQSIENFDLTKDSINILWTAPSNEPSILVLELSKVALIILSRTKLSRLRKVITVQKGAVYDFQYFDDTQTLIKGDIVDVTENGIKLNVFQQLKNYGSPLLNSEFKVVGKLWITIVKFVKSAALKMMILTPL